MKITLVSDNLESIREGYLSLQWPFSDIDQVIDDGEAEEILALSILDKIPFADLQKQSFKIFNKLQHGGIITLDFLDIIDISKAIANRTLSIPDANKLLYNNRKSCLTMNIVIELLQLYGLRILSKRINKYFSLIQAERP